MLTPAHDALTIQPAAGRTCPRPALLPTPSDRINYDMLPHGWVIINTAAAAPSESDPFCEQCDIQATVYTPVLGPTALGGLNGPPFASSGVISTNEHDHEERHQP